MPPNPSDERIPCKNPECCNTILPVTARINDGLCAPCLGKVRKAARDEYIRQNRRKVNLYEGVSDPVEAIQIMQTRRQYDPLIQYLPSPKTLDEWFAELSPTGVERLVQVAADAMEEGNEDLAEDLGKSLAMLTTQNLDAMLLVWLKANHLWPSIVFRDAGRAVRDRILATITGETPVLAVSHALCALAWIGDEVVQRQFAAWEKRPPSWRQNLHAGPAGYARTAGWELVADSRRDLFFHECQGLAVAERGEAANGIALLVERSDVCPWCSDRLVHLIEIPARAAEFVFLEYAADVLPVLTCERCTCWQEHLFARIGTNGQTAWHPSNQRRILPGLDTAAIPWERGPWAGVAASLKHRSAIRAGDWGTGISMTQIGGMPTWVQDATFPSCPDCSETMMFLAQLSNDDFRGYEGTYYAFWCPACRVTATCYQQT